jgi:class 3 adenylate cyclase/tetratricopeptide (TPR) repeat protein
VTTCPSCGRDNVDGARFCIDCGTSLVPACQACGAELPEGARFCPNCGALLVDDGPPPAGSERRLVTILFADVIGSTALGEDLDPEPLQELLAEYFEAMREEIEAEGGTVEKFIGDAIMAAFGVPTAHEDDPARALRAALRMRRRLALVNRALEPRFGVALSVRTGVNTGEVLASVDPDPGDPMVTGDAVNVAARLEQVAEPGQIVVAERTARAARGFRFGELGDRQLRGKQEAVPAVVLEDVATDRPERGVLGLEAPMVGREREVALLRTLYERASAEGRANLVTIYGDPGVGKSRLTREFVEEAERSAVPAKILRGRCLPYGEGITYWPLAEILKGLAGVRDSDPPERTLDRIMALGSDVLTTAVASDPRAATAALAYTVGVEDPETSFGALEPREVRTKIHAAWRSLFSALASESPVIAVIEDIHWADAALLDLLEELAERVVGPVLFLCPSRPEITERRPGWGGGIRNVSSISLEPLSDDDADRLVGFLLKVEELPPAVHGRILERAEGNPFFLEEIVRHLIDEGRIVRESDRWRAAGDIGDVQIPDTVQGVLAARIDLLDPAEKRALQRAAVVGRVFWPEPVGRLLNGDRERLRDTLDRLEERELVRSRLTSSIAGEQEFIFKHVLTRDVAYQTLPRRDRGPAHASVAEWIESTAGRRRAEVAELLAFHYDEAYRGALDDERDPELTARLRGRAFEAVLEAAEVARRRFAVEGALRLADRAIELAASPLERARGLELRGVAARNDYRGDLAWESLRQAVDIRLRDLPEDGVAIASACAQAVENPMRWPGSMLAPPDEDEVRRYIDLGLERAPKGSIEWIRLTTAAAFAPFGYSAVRGMSAGEVEACHRMGLEAAESALAIDRPDLASAALDGASSALLTEGDYGGLTPLTLRRLELAERLDDPWERGDVYDMAAWHWVMIGDYERARGFGNRAFEGLELGGSGLAMHGLSWLALAELQLGQWDRVVKELGPIVERLLGTRADDPPYFTQNMIGSLAVIEELRGDPRAERSAGTFRRMIDRADELGGGALGHGGIRVWLAWIQVFRGSMGEAGQLLEEADRVRFRGHWPFLRQVQAEHLAEAGRWEHVREFAIEARRYAAGAGLRALPIHVDRLEGRHALAETDHARAVELLERASDGFASLHARWEEARTDRFLADALARAGRAEEARSRLADATTVFEELGAARELERAQVVVERWDGA